jgi:hypothetical protein
MRKRQRIEDVKKEEEEDLKDDGRERMEVYLLGASKTDIDSVWSVLSDVEFNQVVDSFNIGKCVWNAEPFADKAGFSNRENAFRAARSRGLIDSDMLLSDAVGRMTTLSPSVEEPTKTILNPVPDTTVVPSTSRARVRFMTPTNLVEWLSSANTDAGRRLRRGMMWLYATIERKRTMDQLHAVQRELQTTRAELAERDQAFAELTAILEEHQQNEAEKTTPPPVEIFKLFKRDNKVGFLKRRPSTLASRVKVFTDLRFQEVEGVEPFVEACDTWDTWHKLMVKKGLCYRDPVRHTSKKGKISHVNTYVYTPVSPVTLDSLLADMKPARAQWLRKVLAKLDGVIDSTQTSLDNYFVPQQQQQ